MRRRQLDYYLARGNHLTAQEKEHFEGLANEYNQVLASVTPAMRDRIFAENGAILLLSGLDELAKRGIIQLRAPIVRPCSFSADTAVATFTGTQTINALHIGDIVLAYNEAAGTMGYYTITAVLAHDDPIIVYVTIDDEPIETTPEHPFYTGERGWVSASELRVGDHIRSAKGGYGVVRATVIVQRSQRMYNLTVAEAHTFFVGGGEWLVHNDCGSFQQHGVRTTAHFWRELRKDGFTEKQAFKAYTQGEKYTDVDGRLIRYDRGTQAAVAVDMQDGGVITIYRSRGPSPDWTYGWPEDTPNFGSSLR
jgi:hypothetical protein